MIYIVKLIDKDGNEFLTHTLPVEKGWKSVNFESLLTSRFPQKESILLKEEWKFAKIKKLKEIPDLSLVQLEMFHAAIEDVKKTKKFRFINGNFPVTSYVRENDENYVYVVKRPDGICRIGNSKNVIQSIYWLLYHRNSSDKFVDYVKLHGTKKLRVFIRGPYSSDEVESELAIACHDFGFWSDFPDWEKKRKLLYGNSLIRSWKSKSQLPFDFIGKK